jgi:hypothetical protein
MECLASVLVQTIKPVPPIEGGAEVVATDGIIYSVGACGSVALDSPLGEDLLQAIIQPACRSTL